MSLERPSARRIRRRLGLLLGLALVLGGAVAFYLSSNHAAPIMSYRLADSRTLIITAGAGAATWTRVARVVETADDVRISVESLDWPVTRNMSLTLVEFTIALSQDLGDRVVRDGSGSVVPRVDGVGE